MIGTDFIVQALRDEGIDHVFLVPGGLIDPFYDSLVQTPGITPIVAAHEGGAAYMADGYARASGAFGACFVIGGPGATNTATALSAALTDEIPVILLSGEVPTDWEGRGGFQDSSPAGLNDVEILRPLTRYSIQVEDPRLLEHHLRAALQEMALGSQAPVHLCVPTNIQKATITHPHRPVVASMREPRVLDHAGIRALGALLENPTPAGRIAILAGFGVVRSGAADALRSLAERYQIPVATTLKAKGVLPEDHPLSVGIFGYAGTRHATELLLGGACEALIVVGSGLDQRDTMYWNVGLTPPRGLVQVDIDQAALGRNYPVGLPIVSDAQAFLEHLASPECGLQGLLEAGVAQRTAWLDQVRDSGTLLCDPENATSEVVPMHPARVITEARAALPRDTVVLVDSGAHRAFAGHYWRSFAPNEYLSATNIGPMGWAIPAAVGAKCARPDQPLLVITGDGCMLMHGMEVQTAARHGLPIIYLVINNSALGNIYLRAKNEPGGALTILPTHDWAAFARSLGGDGVTVEQPGDLAAAFAAGLAARGPFVIDARCSREFPTPVTPFNQAAKEWMDDA